MNADAMEFARRMAAGVPRWGLTLACAAVVGLSGCASGPGADPRDPLEPFNRDVTRFNDAVDKAVLKPVATAYQDVVPSPVRTGVGNFFGNLGDAWSFVNNVLQFRPEAAVDSFMRVSLNTFFGMAGVLDIASEAGIDRHKEDFGQTLGRWGMPPGPYLVLPLLGPSTFRDTAALPVDRVGNVVSTLDHVPTRNSLIALRAVDTRAHLLRTVQVLEQAALDPYSFNRDAFLQKRRNDVYDGAPPEEERWDEPEEVAPAEGPPAAK